MTAAIIASSAPMKNGMRQPHARISSAVRKTLLQDHQHEDRAQLAADQRDVLEARIEAAIFRVGHLD